MKFQVNMPLVLILSFFIGIHTSQAQKNGYIDTQLILAEMPESKKAQSILIEMEEQLQKESQYKNAAYNKELSEYLELLEKGVLSKTQQSYAETSLEKKQKDILEFQHNIANTIRDERVKLLAPIYEKLNTALKEVAKENTIDMVFDKAVVLYSSDASNLTTKVKAKLGF